MSLQAIFLSAEEERMVALSQENTFLGVEQKYLYEQLVKHCTMGKLQWEVGNRNFSFLRENYIWNIWTRIKWEAKLTKVSEIF